MRVPHEALRQRVTVENKAGEGAYGATFEAPRVVRASIQHTQALVSDWKNDQVTIDTVMIIRPEDGPVPIGSKVTQGTTSFVVVKGFAIPDDFRPSHYELMLAAWGFEA